MRLLSKCSAIKLRRTIPIRLKIGIMLFVGSFMVFALRSNFSIILIDMVRTYQWSSYQQSLLLGAYFCGYIGPNLIGGMVAERFGGRNVIFIVFLLSSVITAVSPLTANKNFQYLFCARLLLGICSGFFFCTCHNLISRWAPPEEKGVFISSLLGSKLGIAVTWPLMGFITETFGWQWAFYVTAAMSLAIAYLWLEIVADSPETHPNISRTEKDMIVTSLELVIAKKREFPPIDKMIKSTPFYACMFLHFSDVWGIFFLLTSAPMFMSQVLKFDLKNAGIVSSLPYIARLISGFLFGFVGDYLTSRGVGPTTVRKFFCIFSHIIPGILLFGFCFIEKSAFCCILLITLSLGFNGASSLTSAQNPQDLAPNFAASVFGLSNFVATSSGFISPMVVSYFTSEKSTINEWRSIFILDGSLYIISAIFFIIFGSGEVQKWNRGKPQRDLEKI